LPLLCEQPTPRRKGWVGEAFGSVSFLCSFPHPFQRPDQDIFADKKKDNTHDDDIDGGSDDR
jgi:hypothetical protein